MARGDGRLNHDLIPGEKGPQDACGVFGVWAPGEDVAKLTYFGLYALQHRGQESAGIATGDGEKILVYKDMGLVSQVFDETALELAPGHIAIGHTRYSTTGGQHLGERPADPRRHRPTARSRSPTTATSSTPSSSRPSSTSTSAAPAARRSSSPAATRPTPRSSRRCSPADPDRTLEQAALELLPKLRGAFSLRLHGRARRCMPPATRRASVRSRSAASSAAGSSPPRPPPCTRRRRRHPRGRAR